MAEDTSETIVVPVMEEQLAVEKRAFETRRTRVRKQVKRIKSVIDEPLLRHTHEFERVAVNRVVEKPENPRREGETLIVPVYEERVFIEKRLVLVEELHITRKTEESREPREYELLREEVTVEPAGEVER